MTKYRHLIASVTKYNELYFESWFWFFIPHMIALHNLATWTTSETVSETRVCNVRVERRPIVRATRDKVRVICGGPVSTNYWKLFEHRKQTYRYRGESLWSRMFVLIKVHFEPRISCFLIVLVYRFVNEWLLLLLLLFVLQGLFI